MNQPGFINPGVTLSLINLTISLLSICEDLTSSHVRFIQWQSFIVSFVALGTSFASVAMHRQRDKWKADA